MYAVAYKTNNIINVHNGIYHNNHYTIFKLSAISSITLKILNSLHSLL